MQLKKLFLCLILGLTSAGCFMMTAEKNISRAPQSVAPTPKYIGTYFFVNGTQGCPKEIQWQAECGGFSLTPSDGSEAQRFCSVNRGKFETKERTADSRKKVTTTVTHKENIISKIQEIILSNHHDSIRLHQEDTVIIDETGKFLWEHSKNGNGFSCLYSQ